MKKLATLLCLLLWAVVAYPQEGPTTQPQDHNLFSGLGGPNSGFGIKGGVNFAEVNGSDKNVLGNTEKYTAWHAGLYAQFAVSDFFSLQPELLYSRKGYERNDSTFRFDYLELPVLAVFNLSDNISIHLGPQIAAMVSAQEEDKEVDIERFNTFDYGVAGGFEGRINRFRLGARYSLGLADLIKKDTAGRNVNLDIKPGVLQVYLGLNLF